MAMLFFKSLLGVSIIAFLICVGFIGWTYSHHCPNPTAGNATSSSEFLSCETNATVYGVAAGFSLCGAIISGYAIWKINQSSNT